MPNPGDEDNSWDECGFLIKGKHWYLCSTEKYVYVNFKITKIKLAYNKTKKIQIGH